MKKISISIPFDDEKLDAARFYAGRKEASLEDELVECLQKLYEKYVPRDTREYLEQRAAPATKPKSKPAAVPRKPEPSVMGISAGSSATPAGST